MRRHNLHFVSSIAMACLVAAAAGVAAPAPGYRILAQYPIGGTDTGYDYVRVDPATHRVFVAHGTRVEVLDTESGKKVGEITGMHGVHGIELVPDLGKGYTSDGLDRALTVFDAKTLKVRGRIKYLGVKPDALQYDPETHLLYVVNGSTTGDVSIIDPKTDAIVGTIDLGGGKLEQIGFDGRGHAFVNDEDKSVIHVFDTHTREPTGTWTLGACKEPTGMAVDSPHHRVFAACGNEKLAVLDTDSGRVVAEPTIGSDPDGAAFDQKSQRIFTSNREGTLSVLHEVAPDHYETVQTLTTQPGARTLALDETNGRIYMPTARTGPAPAGGGNAPLLPETFVLLVAGE